jgi:serine protease Do
VGQQVGLPMGRGVYVVLVLSERGGSPASKAGILAGDVILRWNDAIVNNPAELTNAIGKTPIGSRAKVLVWREGEEFTFEVTVGERPLLD